MDTFDLQLVPWRVEYEAVTDATTQSWIYSNWAAELGVSDSESLVEINGDDFATAISFGYPPFPGAVADAFIASEGGIGFYQEVPANKTSTAYDLVAQNISRMYGFATRPNLLLSFHYQNNLKLLNSKIQSRYGVTILYLELALYSATFVRLYVALRFEPGLLIVHSRAASYSTNWILTELNPATGAVIKSSQILAQASGTHYRHTYRLSNNVGLLASPGALTGATILGTVHTVSQLRTPAFPPFAGLGSVSTTGRLRASPFAAPVLSGTVFWPVLASHQAPWSDVAAAATDHAAPWSGMVASRLSHQAPWRMRLESSLAAVWSIPLRPPFHALSWGDLTVTQASRAHPWSDTATPRQLHAAVWAEGIAPRRSHQSPWADTTVPRTQHQALWENVATVAQEHVAFWEDGVAPRRSFMLAWSDRSRASRDQVLGWGDGELPSAAHQAAWGDISAPRRSLASPWADTSSATATHALTWGDAHELRVSLAAPWADRSRATWDLLSPWQDAVPVPPVALVVSWSNYATPGAAMVSPWADGASGRKIHGAVWGDKPDIRVTHAAVYADRAHGVQPFQASWDEAVAASRGHHLWWGDQSGASRVHQASWGALPASRATLAAVYADREAAASVHAAAWSGRIAATAAHGGSWYLTGSGRRAHAAVWTLVPRPVARFDLLGRWALLENLSLVSISNVPEVLWQGQALTLHGARLSQDEDSPVWIAEEIELADLAAWGAIQLGDTIQFRVMEETWTLRVDGKGMNRPQVGDLRLSLSAVSPLAWLDAPYAAAITLDNSEGPVSARATVAALLSSVGEVRWDLDDWLIPAGALAMSDTTPLQAAREIVAAIGGVLESDPDGTPVARWRHPVSVPDYAVATTDHAIQDADLFAFQVSAAPTDGFNRLIISNEDLTGADATDRMEYLDEDANAYDGEMRAWPNPWRPVTLGHTGHPETEIEALGARAHSQTELVEFVAGRGQVKYPVQAITRLIWQHADLGTVSAQGFDLTATTAGESLAWVTYTSLSLDWRVALARDEAVQFVLI